MHRLERLTIVFNATAVVTNQVMAKPDGFFGFPAVQYVVDQPRVATKLKSIGSKIVNLVNLINIQAKFPLMVSYVGNWKIRATNYN